MSLAPRINLLPSAARTGAGVYASAPMQNMGKRRGAYFTLNVTANAAAEQLTLKVQIRDQAGNWQDIFSAAAAYTSVGTATYALYPGDIAGVTEAKKLSLPNRWRAAVVHAGGNAATWSLQAQLVD